MSTTKAKITVKPSQPVLAAWAPSMRLYSAALTKTPSSNGCRPQRQSPAFDCLGLVGTGLGGELTLAESQLALTALASLAAGERDAFEVLPRLLRLIGPTEVPVAR